MSDIRFQLLIDNAPDLDLGDDVQQIEVIEAIEAPTQINVILLIDIVDDDFALLDDERLKPSGDDHKLTVIASVDGNSQCIGHGIIVDRHIGYTRGGTASTLMLSAVDRRVLMNREVKFDQFEGTASEVVKPILEFYEFEAKVEDTDVDFKEADHTLIQNCTDLQFVTRLAGRHGLRFWVDYSVESNPFTGTEVKETAHFEHSPPRSDGGGGGLGGIPVPLPSILSGGGPKDLRLNTGPTSNLESFSVKTNNETANQSTPLARVNAGDGEVDDMDVTGSTLDPLGDAPAPPQKRTRLLVTAGSIEEARTVNAAAIDDAAWVVEASVEATAHALGDLIRPRDLVNVKGTGATGDGDYFVESVTHTITPADHRMTLELRRNAFGA